jgi:hypothetical protein
MLEELVLSLNVLKMKKGLAIWPGTHAVNTILAAYLTYILHVHLSHQELHKNCTSQSHLLCCCRQSRYILSRAIKSVSFSLSASRPPNQNWLIFKRESLPVNSKRHVYVVRCSPKTSDAINCVNNIVVLFFIWLQWPLCEKFTLRRSKP